MIHGIKLKIKEQRGRLRIEEAKQPKDRNPRKIQSLKMSIRVKKIKCRELKLKQSKGRYKK